MRKILATSVIAIASLLSASAAEPLESGYYRVKNYATQRYIYVYDNTGSIEISAGSADVGALQVWKNYERTISDPASILYANYKGSPASGNYQYDVESQGTSIYEIIEHYLSIYRRNNGHLNLYASMGGITKYLDDEETNLNREQGAVGFDRDGDFRLWDVYPVDAADESNYFGVAPTISASGKYYQPFYASFPFSFYSQGMKAYYIKEYNAAENIAVLAEVNGNVPGAMPVIIECSSNQPINNRLNLLRNNDAPLQDNQLSGVYFYNEKRKKSHDAKTAYDPQTMRVLSTDASGKLVFTKYAGAYLPANQSYLVVPEGTPDDVTIMTETEYNQRIVLVTGIALNTSEATLKVGETLQLTASVLPQYATDMTVSWTSDAPEIAAVDANGVVTAVAPGNVVITAKANDASGVSASCALTIEQTEGILTVQADAIPSDVYSLSGVKVRKSGDSLVGLKSGIYVMDGKKIMIY